MGTVSRAVEDRLLPLDRLGLSSADEQALRAALEPRRGLILFAEPSGSGKMTTAWAALGELARRGRHVATVEDCPAAALASLAGIRQGHADGTAETAAAMALRRQLARTPDVLYASSARDRESAILLVQAARTRLLALVVLEAGDGAEALASLQGLGVPGPDVADAALAVVSQRLVRRVCPDCAVPSEASPYMRRRFAIPDGFRGFFRKAQGCPACGHSGYAGRRALYELLMVDDRLRQALRRGLDADGLRQMALARGLRPLRQDGLVKAAEGVTTLEEAWRATGRARTKGCGSRSGKG